MATPPPPLPGITPSFVDRVKNILLTPKTEWEKIDAEPATVQGLYTSYIMILAAIGPIAGLIGQQVFGLGGLGPAFRPTLTYSIGVAVISYVLGLASVYIVALIIDGLAPSFRGTKNFIQAFKVSAYAQTAGWLAGIFLVLPQLAILSLVGLYSLYLYYLGIPRLMRVAQDQAVAYVVVVIVIYVILFFLIGYLALTLAGSLLGAPLLTTVPAVRIG